MPITDNMKTTAEVAALLGRHHSSISRHARMWKIGTRIAGVWLFSPADIERLRFHTARKGGPIPRKEKP